ncbi:MAG: PA2779 family protein [Alphaproteobacteria bacterium]
MGVDHKVETFLAREDVKGQLVVLGVDPSEAAVRVASLTDSELAQIAGRLDELPAGEGAVGAIVGAIVLIFLVLLVTDLLVLTDVFPFVKKH